MVLRLGSLWQEARSIPTTQLPSRFNTVMLLSSVGHLISGIMIIPLGGAIAGVSSRNLNPGNSAPPLWWPGIVVCIAGLVGTYIIKKRRLIHVWFWAVITFMLALVQTIILSASGAFSITRYNVWPIISESHKSHPVCAFMVDRCFCQDYFHGKLAEELPHVQYIHEDVRWKDTGFINCNDVTLLSWMYYSAMACIALYLLAVAISIGSIPFVLRFLSTSKKKDLMYLWREDSEEEDILYP